jgi:hypothetical protein
MTDLNGEATTRPVVPERTLVSSKIVPKAEAIHLPV